MLTAIKGYYDHGQIIMLEDIPVQHKTDVIVIFLSEEVSNGKVRRRIPGALKGKVSIPDDFDEPIQDLKDYM